MRFIHIADIHLGAKPDVGYPWCEDRTREFWTTLEKVVQKAEQTKTDLLLIAGDLFHRQPLLKELKEIDYLFRTLTRTKVVIIAGNHDYIRHDSNYCSFVWSENIHFLGGDKLQSVYFKDINTEIYGLSYYSREITEPLYHQTVPLNCEHTNILLAHGGDEKHIPINRSIIQRSGFDYIALGHIHRHMVLQENKIVYAGSLEPTEIGDTGKHGYIYGEVRDKEVKAEFVPFACREYIELEAEVDASVTSYEIREKIRQQIEILGTRNIYKLILTGLRHPDIVYETERFSECGNIVQVRDETRPEYDLNKLAAQYEDHIVGIYIRSFSGQPAGSVEEKALLYGIQALMNT